MCDRRGVKECEAKARQERELTVDAALPPLEGVWNQQEEEPKTNRNHTHTQTHSLLSKVTKRTTENTLTSVH